jgi:hypothetical protein
MKLAIGDEVERTTAHARAVIRSSDEAGLVATKPRMQMALMNSLCGTKRASSESRSE